MSAWSCGAARGRAGSDRTSLRVADEGSLDRGPGSPSDGDEMRFVCRLVSESRMSMIALVCEARASSGVHPFLLPLPRDALECKGCGEAFGSVELSSVGVRSGRRKTGSSRGSRVRTRLKISRPEGIRRVAQHGRSRLSASHRESSRVWIQPDRSPQNTWFVYRRPQRARVESAGGHILRNLSQCNIPVQYSLSQMKIQIA